MAVKRQPLGFAVIGVVIIILIITIVGFGGWYVWHRGHKSHPSKAPSNSNMTQSTGTNNNQQTDPYAGWNTYTDTGYTAASGMRVMYPSDWEVKVGGSKAFAWTITQKVAPQAGIDVRVTFLDPSNTPQQEWDNCPSPDACGPSSGDTKLSDSTSSINGLDSYSVKMQSATGPYLATVIKSNKPSGEGTAYVEFLLYSSDPSTVSTYKKIVASANIPN